MRSDVVESARGWLGTRWQHQASVKGVGTDCIGFIAGVALECGSVDAARYFATPEYRSYGRDPLPAMLRGACADLMDAIPISQALPADIYCMRFAADPMHFAFLSTHDHIIHAYAKARRVVEHRLDALWSGRIMSAYRLRGIR